MICWQCGAPLKKTKGPQLLAGCHLVDVHRKCEQAALEYLRHRYDPAPVNQGESRDSTM